ncbi:transporter substrate-binding domain-containing protein [Yaniella halotolerans]|uniref:transporter substrate-binding domain-containing protein n=1 Tax=Yaniella halotolerans TaxID=225453 RepID=UPI0003B54AFE|nr:transporter substrate-binding domain-containing protein [Yaniella halotolerans]
MQRNNLVHSMVRSIVLCGVVFGLVGCGNHYPADPEGTLDRVTGGTIRAGISHEPPWTDITTGGNTEEDPGGIEVELIEDYADSIGAEVEWQAGGEEELIGLLGERELDLVVGGLTDQSPWSSDVAMSAPYAESSGIAGSTDKNVVAIQMGENAFMTSVEEFLLNENVDQQLPEEMRP